MNNETRYKIKEALRTAGITLCICGLAIGIFFTLLVGTMGVLIKTGAIQ